MRLTDEDLDAIEARERSASPKPWRESLLNDFTDATSIEGPTFSSSRNLGEEELDEDASGYMRMRPEVQAQIHADATFIAHAREDVPRLVEENRRLRRALHSISLQRCKHPHYPCTTDQPGRCDPCLAKEALAT